MAGAHPVSLGKRLRQERELRHWTQEQLAEKIGRSVPSINRWEHDRAEPQLDALKELTALFGKPPDRWGTSRWNVPFLRNPYFTGREELLLRLHRTLAAEKTVTLSQTRAISGLGGIGKTQIAIEYAYRYAREYEAVLWVQADSHEILVSDFARLAQILDLPDKEEKEQWRIVRGVKRWLQEHSTWLLILDNADDLTVIADFLPRGVGGATLVTTRSQVSGKIARSISVEKMEVSEGLRFVLRRATLLSEDEPLETVSAATRIAAQQLVEELDGLPLALDQAGAYIEETGCSLSEYLALYARHRLALLKRQSSMASDYPHTVASTWTLSFSQVEQANPAAADLLRVCAFLHPDAIPEAILTEGAAVLGPHLQKVATEPLLLNEAIHLLRRYSLVKRDAEAKLLNMHRLVQVVLKESLDEATRQQWAERTVLAVNVAFPEPPFVEWSQCERLLPHVLVCTTWIEQEQRPTLEASSLLDKAGSYLREQGQYGEAKRLLEAAVSIREQHLEAEDLLATSLSNLAGLSNYQGKYAEAEQLVERAYSIRERVLGVEHSDTATSLSHLALLAMQQGKHTQAETLFERALVMYRQSLGADHPTVARTMGNLAVLYEDQGRYRQAEQLNEQVLSIYEQQLEPTHPAIARALSNLALISWRLRKYEKAKALFERALSIQESEILDAAYSLSGLAEISREQGEYEQAEKHYKQVLAIREQYLEADHPDRAEALEGMADVCRERKRCAEAQQLYQRALHIWEQRFGPESLQMTRSLTGLAHLAREQGKYAEAEYLYRRALQIHEQGVKPQHPNTAETTDGLAQLRETQGDSDEAKSLYIRTLAIREQAFGAHHSKTTETRTRLIDLLHTMSQHEDAAQLEAVQSE